MRSARAIVTLVLLAIGCGGSGTLPVGAGPGSAASCVAATNRVATLCPQVPVQDACSSPRPDCTATCMGQVQTCSDVFCSFCQACDCVGDRFGACYQQCAGAGGGSP